VYNAAIEGSDPSYEKAGKIDAIPASLECTLVGFLDGSYYKFPDDYDSQVIMEYAPFSDYLSKNLPGPLATNTDFQSYMREDFPWQYSKGAKYGEMLF